MLIGYTRRRALKLLHQLGPVLTEFLNIFLLRVLYIFFFFQLVWLIEQLLELLWIIECLYFPIFHQGEQLCITLPLAHVKLLVPVAAGVSLGPHQAKQELV